jgi:hypothetical protein
MMAATVFGAGPVRLYAGNAAADAPPDAAYSISIAGSVTGNGTAALSGGKLSITATVTGTTGAKGTLSITDLAISKGRYTGSGTVLGQSLTISGRLDDIPPGDAQVKTQRLVGTFTIADGTHGRVAGFVPPPGDPRAVPPPSTPPPTTPPPAPPPAAPPPVPVPPTPPYPAPPLPPSGPGNGRDGASAQHRIGDDGGQH